MDTEGLKRWFEKGWIVKSITRLAGMLSASLLLMVGSAGNSHASVSAPVSSVIYNMNSNKCLSVPAASQGFEYLNQFSCGIYPDQTWTRDWVAVWGGTTWYKIVNDNSGLCLSVDKASQEDYARATQFPCGSPSLHPDQYWSFINYDSGTKSYQLRNRNSGKCLAIQDGSKEETAWAIQFTCRNYKDHFWLVP
ncbi:RICIN domain-containing protein [Streptomyces microflavus]